MFVTANEGQNVGSGKNTKKTKLVDDEVAKVFSPQAVRDANVVERRKKSRKIELNELAKQVAQQFSTNVIAPGLINGFARLSRVSRTDHHFHVDLLFLCFRPKRIRTGLGRTIFCSFRAWFVSSCRCHAGN